MESNKKVYKRPDVLRKLNAENLQLIERGLLGDLPERFKPQPPGPVRGQSTDLAVPKTHGLLTACLPVPMLDSPSSVKSLNLDEDKPVSPLKKTYSFREKFSRISFFGKDKTHEKPKWKSIVEEERDKAVKSTLSSVSEQKEDKSDHELKSNKRFWFFRNRELVDKREKSTRPVYTRSKSFEFLPRAAADSELPYSRKTSLSKNQSYAFGSSDTMMDSWSSNESLEQLANVYYDKVDTVHLKSIRELQDSDHNSSISTATSSSGLVVNIMKTDSVQDLLDEFHKAIDMFSENYQSDCEPYTQSYTKLSVEEKRKSSSFSTLPSPKVVQVTKMSKVDDDFKTELSKMIEVRRASENVRTVRRGSVTDWFVLEENNLPAEPVVTAVSEANKYRRAQKKPMQRVRRISSTKYVSA
ncbi:unnamed protein product [Colias eurytheme]|nr:unnamed protein product [Colias eurytheme]